MLSFDRVMERNLSSCTKLSCLIPVWAPPGHCSGPLDAQCTKPRPTDHVNPQQGSQSPPGNVGGILCLLLGHVFCSCSQGRNRWGMGVKL